MPFVCPFSMFLFCVCMNGNGGYEAVEAAPTTTTQASAARCFPLAECGTVHLSKGWGMEGPHDKSERTKNQNKKSACCCFERWDPTRFLEVSSIKTRKAGPPRPIILNARAANCASSPTPLLNDALVELAGQRSPPKPPQYIGTTKVK